MRRTGSGKVRVQFGLQIQRARYIEFINQIYSEKGEIGYSPQKAGFLWPIPAHVNTPATRSIVDETRDHEATIATLNRAETGHSGRAAIQL